MTDKIYTQEDMDKAVETERNEIIIFLYKLHLHLGWPYAVMSAGYRIDERAHHKPLPPIASNQKEQANNG